MVAMDLPVTGQVSDPSSGATLLPAWLQSGSLASYFGWKLLFLIQNAYRPSWLSHGFWPAITQCFLFVRPVRP